MTDTFRPRVIVLIGTRPEAIKLAPVILALREYEAQIETDVCLTGQHRELLETALADFDISSEIRFDLMTTNQTLASLSSRLFAIIDDLIVERQPSMLIIQGDTTTAMAAAMCGYYRRVPVAHVEAGLRSFDVHAPFPEEANRKIVSLVSSLHFAPSELSARNLEAEGVPAGSIHVTGNTVVDALHFMLESVSQGAHLLSKEIECAIGQHDAYVLVTGHRRECFGAPLSRVCEAIAALSRQYPRILFIFPVHPNPNIRTPVAEALGSVPGVLLIDPQSYSTLVWLLKNARYIITDSGGILEEAVSLGKQVAVTRDKTERPEGIAAGYATLVGTDPSKIISAVRRALDTPNDTTSREVQGPYGDGKASIRIARIISDRLTAPSTGPDCRSAFRGSTVNV